MVLLLKILQDLQQDLQFRGWIGGVEVVNCSDPVNSLSIDVASGNVILGPSNTEGIIVVRGTGTLSDNTGPNCTVISTGLVNPKAVAASVRLELTSELDDIEVTRDHARATNSQTQGT